MMEQGSRMSLRHNVILQIKQNFSEVITEVNCVFTSPFGFFVLIADPKVVVATETINSKEKIKLTWSILNLQKNKREDHPFPVTRSSTDSPKVASKTFVTNIANFGNKQHDFVDQSDQRPN